MPSSSDQLEIPKDGSKCGRRAMIERLLHFFNAPIVKNLSLQRKCAFLRQKGLKQDGECDQMPNFSIIQIFVLTR
jgi:hypothetical protein